MTEAETQPQEIEQDAQALPPQEAAALPEGEAEFDIDAPDYAAQLRMLEAILFASAEPLAPHAMRERLPGNADLGGLLMDLQKAYEGKGVNLIEVNGSWAFRTASDLGNVLQISREVKRKLSRAAMETLAVIAYHQPVTRAEVENIRGVATHKGTLDVLIESGWVKPGRRREAPGRPLTWVTTTSFMDHFGLESLTDLPGMDELKAAGLLDRRPAIETLPGTRDLFEKMEDESAADTEEGEEDDNWEDAYEEAGEGNKELAKAAAEEEFSGEESSEEEDEDEEENDDEFEDDDDEDEESDDEEEEEE